MDTWNLWIEAFAKSRKGILASSCLSVRMEQLRSQYGWRELVYFCIFRKSVKNIQISLKSVKNATLHIKTYVQLSYRMLLKMNMCRAEVVEPINHTLFMSNNFFENVSFMRQCRKVW